MDEDFMTTKEKDYVNYIFTKNLKQFKTEINYKQLFKDIKQDYLPVKTETKTSFVFGKDTCRDNKKNRYFSCTQNIPNSLKLKLELDNLITKSTFKKYFNSDFDFEIDVQKFIEYDLLWKLLDLEFTNLSNKKNTISIIIQNFEKIRSIKEFTSFVNEFYDKIPKFEINEIDNHFLTHFMTKSAGLVLATCLLINNESLFDVFYTNLTIRIDSSLSFSEVWNFLAVLMKFCDKDQKFRLVKLTRNKLLEIRSDKEKFSSAGNFFKCLGIEPEDLLE